MPSITRYKDKWRVQVRKGHKRASKVFNTKREANAWGLEQESILLNNQDTLSGYTLRDALQRYLEEVTPTKLSQKSESIRLNKFMRDKLATVPLDRIDSDDIYEWLEAQTNAPNTVRRELSIIQSVIKEARKWRWTNQEPFKDFDWPKRGKHRDRLITDEEVELLISLGYFKEGKKPDNASGMVILALLIALETAMRKGEIIAMRWEDVYLNQQYVHLPVTKNGHSRDVPLNKRAVELLTLLEPKKKGKVFNITIGTASTMFYELKKQIGVMSFTFHDSRHTAITRMARKLTILELTRTVGHSDPRMLMTYYNESATALAARLDSG